MPHYPLTVIFDLRHNHPIAAGDVLRCRDVGPEARATITQLLQDNRSPSSALETLQSQHPNDYLQLSADRYHCPDLKWCYRYTYVYLFLYASSLVFSERVRYMSSSVRLLSVCL